MASFQPHPSLFLLLLLLINPTLALSQNDSLKIALGVSLGVIVVMMIALGTFLYIRHRKKKMKKNVLGNTFHPRFGDTSITAPERGWSHLSPLRSHYPKSLQPGKKSPGSKRLLDPETSPDVQGLQELKEISPSPSLASSAPSPPAATYTRSSLPHPSRPPIPLQRPAEPTKQDKPFVLATDLSSKKARHASPQRSQQRQASPPSPDQHRPKHSSKTFPSVPAPNSDVSDLEKPPRRSHELPQPKQDPPKSLTSTLLPSIRRKASPSPARAPQPQPTTTLPSAGPVVYKPVSESYLANLSRMSTEHENHYGYPSQSHPTANPSATSHRLSHSHRQRSTSRGSRTRSRSRDAANRSGSADPPFPRHPAYERRTSETSTVYEVDTSDERGFGEGRASGGGVAGMGYASDYENRGRWGLKGKKEAVGEEDLYG